MDQKHGAADVEIPQAIVTQLMGLGMTYVNVPMEALPLGAELSLTRTGELMPCVRGRIGKGTGILLIDAESHMKLRKIFADAIAKAEADKGESAKPS